MTILNTQEILAAEGFRTANSRMGRILEAATLFNDAESGNAYAQARLLEAFTTSDFPGLLGAAFEIEAIHAYRAADPEWKLYADEFKVTDFKPKRLLDILGRGYFEDVAQGAEYKAAAASEEYRDIQAGKTGKLFGLTWELRKNRDFTELSDFSTRLANDGIRTANRKVMQAIADATGFKASFFGSVDNKPLTADNLDAALNGLALKTNFRGDMVDTSKMVLLHSPGNRSVVRRLLTATEVEFTDGNKKVKLPNPWAGIVTPVESKELAATITDTGKRATSWALLPAPGSENPAVAKVTMTGEEDVDIRVKRDQGAAVGGGDLPVEAGSFNDDTIWYRGRLVTGGAALFADATYASAGA